MLNVVIRILHDMFQKRQSSISKFLQRTVYGTIITTFLSPIVIVEYNPHRIGKYVVAITYNKSVRLFENYDDLHSIREIPLKKRKVISFIFHSHLDTSVNLIYFY